MTSTDGVRVDIVVNNHNYGRFVGEAVDSALGQNHTNLSVIVVDDGSSDNSRSILKSYEQDVELVFQQNGGQASALNAGFARGHGEVVIFLDADDVLDPSAAGHAAAAFAADPDAARLQFRIQPVGADGRSLGETPGGAARKNPPARDLRFAELLSPFEMSTVPTSANAFRRKKLEQIMPVPEDRYRRVGADYYLVHLSTLLGDVLHHPAIGARYRIHGANAFQPSLPVLDLARVRLEIEYQLITMEYLSQLADRLSLEFRRPIISMSNVTLRVISHRLDASSHPVPDDRALGLLAAALRATRRRRDLAPAARLAQMGALAGITVLPRRLAIKLAELVIFPELRRRLWLRPGSVLGRRSARRGDG